MKVILVQMAGMLAFILITSFVFIKKTRHHKHDQDINFLALIILTSFILNAFKNYIFTHYCHLDYPLNTFLFRPEDRFNDFFNVINACKENSPYLTPYWLKSNYFPVGNTIFYLLSMLGSKYMLLISVYIVFILLYFFFVRSMFGRKIRFEEYTSFLALLLLTYPFLMNLDRGNIEVFLFLSVWGFFYFYNKGKTYTGLIFLALAISIKLFPGVFLILLLKDRKYKNIVFTLLLVILSSVISMLTFDGSFMDNIKALLNTFADFNNIFNNWYWKVGLQHNVSLYGAIKVISFAIISLFGGTFDNSVFLHALPWYTMGVFLIFILLCIHIVFIEKSEWKNVTLLTIALLILPNVSFDYKLIYILVPLSFFLKQERQSGFRNLYLLLFSLLLVPHNYFYINSDISIAVLIYPLILLIISGLIIYEGLQKKCRQEFPNTIGNRI